MHSGPILIAEGPGGEPQEFALERSRYLVGRADGSRNEDRIPIEGDPLLSRHHFDIEWKDGKLSVQRSQNAKNPIFFLGNESDSFEVTPGQIFLSGNTRFKLLLKSSVSDTPPTTEFTLIRTEFQPLSRPNTNECFRALVELLPELRGSADENTAFRGALKVLKELLPGAAEFSILRVGESPESICHVLAAHRQKATPPSNRLLARAFEANGTIAHVWSCQGGEASLMTEHAQADWAVASPVDVAGQEHYAIYVVGTAPQAFTATEAQREKEYLDGMTSLVDIVAETLGHHLAVAHLNRFEGQVTRFFSPVLRDRLSGREFSEVLLPRRRDVTVLFFDLRGFSRATEAADEELDAILGHHELLTEVMTAVTDCVFAQDGVVVDYQGDAVMACWGSLSDGAEADKAVRAARAILERIYAMDLPFKDTGPKALRCGIGLAAGEAIVGQIGAREQIKFGVLGQVVNLASRLEGLTKYFGIPVLLSGQARKLLGEEFLCRQVGLVRPAGVNEACDVHELVLGRECGGSGLTPEEVEAFEKAYDFFRAGNMNEAYEHLLSGSRPTDPVGRFLTRHTLRYLDDGLPPHFDGVLEFQRK